MENDNIFCNIMCNHVYISLDRESEGTSAPGDSGVL